MARPVLHRVCHGTTTPTPLQESLLTILPALLPHYTRHQIRGRDYPAIIPTPSKPTSCVRGTLVTGLTDGDIYRLDIFEAEEYDRVPVTVKILDPKTNEEVGESVCEAYVWAEGMEGLEDEEWDFEDFVKEKMGRWIGDVVGDVDEAVRALERGEDPTGGRGMLEGGRRERDVVRGAV